MAVVITHVSGSPGGPVPVIGSFLPFALIKATTPGTTTVDIAVSGLNVIEGAIIQVLDSGNNVVTSDVDVIWSGNTVTVADGSSFSLTNTYTIYLLVWGKPRV